MDVSLIIDWLGREGGYVLRWWLLVTLAGAAAWPLLWRVMGGLPDRGYTLARAAGLMLTGFVFWFLGSVGMLDNAPGGMVFAWAVVLALSVTAFVRWQDRPPLRPWLREHWPLIVLAEVLFALLLFGWAVVRASNPLMAETEKPMEIMFVNSIRASDAFPPRDAWLSGYAISYYYFGYVIVAMLSDLSGVSSSIGFNITIALVFALTGTGALGVVYNMVRARALPGRLRAASRSAALAAGLLGVCFLILMGNLGTALVEFPWRGYASGLVNAAYFDFWDLEGRAGTQTVTLADGSQAELPTDTDGDGVPNWDEDAEPVDAWTFTYGLGWRYSRVVHDRDLNGSPHPVQPITEFPNFSFLLSDIHPHVLALPFAVLAIGLALNLVLGGRELLRWEYPLYAVWVGGMVFMNSWDLIYLPLLLGAEVLRRVIRNGRGALHMDDIRGLARFSLGIGGLTLVLYSPWVISFSSQAGGILPNMIYPTPWQQFFLQFGTFLVILSVYLIVEVRRAGWRFYWQSGMMGLALVVLVLILMLAVFGLSAWGRDDVRDDVYSVWDASGGLGALMPDILAQRVQALPSELLLAGIVFLVVGRLFARPARLVNEETGTWRSAPDMINYSPATGFALLLVGAGTVLTLAPDFVYLRDNFAVRINTVFKLYYQGWIMFSMASAFAVWSVLAGGEAAEDDTHRLPDGVPGVSSTVGRVAFALVVAVFFAAGMLYPVIATHARALVDSGRTSISERIDACEAGEQWAASFDGTCPDLPRLTLDGVPTMISADEYAAVQCLNDLERDKDAVLVEAPGGAYEPHKSRFSGLTGIPTLIGWTNHEHQWRGPTYPEVTDVRYENGQRRDRVSDVQDLYTTQDWARAWQVIDRYGIDYIVIAGAERSMIQQLAGDDDSRLREYQLGLAKFEQVFMPVCEAGSAVVFRVAPG